MIKVITTTTIFPPSESLIKFAAMKDWQLVIAGDKKTPVPWGLDPGHYYLTLEIQEKIDPKLSDLIGWNCIQRRNFAFLFACKELKADIIATVDDDNIPMENWGENVNVGNEVVCDEYVTRPPAFDPIIGIHGFLDFWHRGFPLELVQRRFKPLPGSRPIKFKADVQADLWNGDPDVDAICRLIFKTTNIKLQSPYRPFTSNKPSPFNSQNTFLSREVMPHYFMFPGIGRYDDIMASYHVQAQGFRVMYGGPTVTQIRNKHNLIEDLKNEMWGMEHALAVVKDIPHNKNAVLDILPARSLEAFKAYQKHFQ